ncbi:hypothetical protein OCC_10564 [Thermococcus litoralis DSM 5473]|uniref:Uncharacterized protein n=1 Tax=Thermococcus litoralis (strain ATCC 51850 / DSM 5473 / JCM 8560 / NS-C) TaxID=523849 RepID=H3ZR71_THELN|nr:hypothetical protein [Thermococcus litoralis]EHR77540.1 hypothetical protein OCC_10564 [Thermococcus litoralis DSM 5473]
MAEDIEEKIRRLRELGRVSVEEKEEKKAPTAPIPRASPPQKAFEIGKAQGKGET